MSEEESVERLSVAEAAEVLGVTRDAIHKRIRRGSVEYEKGEDGRFYVYVDTSTTELDESTDSSGDKSKVEGLERLVDSYEDRIAFLERELERRSDETARLHQIVAGLTQVNARLAARVPELAPPQETPGAAEAADEQQGRRQQPQQPRSEAPGAQEPVQRPWWRRVFGG